MWAGKCGIISLMLGHFDIGILKMFRWNFKIFGVLEVKIVKIGQNPYRFFNISAYRPLNNLILVPTLHNIWGIMGGRDKN